VLLALRCNRTRVGLQAGELNLPACEIFKEVVVMERAVVHYHVDVLTTESRPLWSSPALPKGAAKREFEQVVGEYRKQVGKFVIHSATERDWERGFVGAVRLAENHKLVITLTRCDCLQGGE